MSAERLSIGLDPQEGALVRVLGLVERRGFALASVAMSGERVSLVIEPRGDHRKIDVLARQLERLADVRSVAVSTSHPGPTA